MAAKRTNPLARSRRRILLAAATGLPPVCAVLAAAWALRAPEPQPQSVSLQIAARSETPQLREPLDASAFDAVLWHAPPPPPTPEVQPEPTPVVAAAPPPPPPPPAIQLLAILTLGQPQSPQAESEQRLAIAYDPDADEIRRLRSGDHVAGGWSVESVTDDALTLRREHRTVAIALDPDHAMASPQSAQPRRRR